MHFYLLYPYKIIHSFKKVLQCVPWQKELVKDIKLEHKMDIQQQYKRMIIKKLIKQLVMPLFCGRIMANQQLMFIT